MSKPEWQTASQQARQDKQRPKDYTIGRARPMGKNPMRPEGSLDADPFDSP
jgi:hypothetical protein